MERFLNGTKFKTRQDMLRPFFLLIFALLGIIFGLKAQTPSDTNANQRVAQLYALMQGTFVAYAPDEKERWRPIGGDSVILLVRPISVPGQGGYWLYSYEFSTATPNHPLYTSIKRIEPMPGDSFLIHYYTPPASYELSSVLREDFAKEWNMESLSPTDKRAVYHYQPNASFTGYSQTYEDKDCRCLRRNLYDLNATRFHVESTFFNRKDREVIDRKNRPNTMVRRSIDKTTLWSISQKNYWMD